jgi:hypothetical protein
VARIQALGVYPLDLAPLGGTAMEWEIVQKRTRVANVILLPDMGEWWKSSGENEGTLCDVFIRLDDEKSYTIQFVVKRTGEKTEVRGTYAYDGDSGLTLLYDGKGRPDAGGQDPLGR